MVCVFDEPLTDVAVLPGDLEADLLGNTNDLRRGMVGEGIGGRSGGGGGRGGQKVFVAICGAVPYFCLLFIKMCKLWGKK